MTIGVIIVIDGPLQQSGFDYVPACIPAIIKELDGKKRPHQIKEDEPLDTLLPLLHPAATSLTAEWGSSVPAAASTHAEDPWQKLGAKPTAVLISTALLP